ncbi:WD40/YVTN/BNR-like repeat-containing protein [Euzebya tangerina]|uniref:WD40/YVTN/BNR-like repeat-containing protein n=1 Tax=Euzebya tangerina TaxID=591198 RepID=UPI000E317D4A|nr:exo-alpha-sialidase [Euzebya tangerina]
MTQVRVLIGTAKGAFVATRPAAGTAWQVEGPHFGGWEVYHLKGSPIDPDRVWAAPSTGWHGQVIQHSKDGGRTWEVMGNEFAYRGETRTHQWYDGTPHPWEFARVWHLEPSPVDVDTIYAGVEDAALFRSTDAGRTWSELEGLRTHSTAGTWQPGAGGLCLHTIILNPDNPDRIFVAISAAGAFRSDDGGITWLPINTGLDSGHLPDQDATVGHCVHNLAQHPDRPDTLFMQKHWDVLRTDDAGDHWREVSGNLPSDFGFPIEVDPNDPETIFVVPILSDSEHYPPDGKMRVARSRTGGDQWELLTEGLPQAHAYGNILRDAMSLDAEDPCGIYVGTTDGVVYASDDGGDHWAPIVEHLPRILSVEAQSIP